MYYFILIKKKSVVKFKLFSTNKKETKKKKGKNRKQAKFLWVNIFLWNRKKSIKREKERNDLSIYLIIRNQIVSLVSIILHGLELIKSKLINRTDKSVRSTESKIKRRGKDEGNRRDK